MGTVRIYRVAELVGMTSQDIVSMLKKEHGIDVKSASSTIEEVVGRQLVERLARQKNISLPSGDMFAETPVAKGKKGGAPSRKHAEPQRPTAPALPPPRLVKSHKPAVPVAAETEAAVDLEPAPISEAPAPEMVAQAPAAADRYVEAAAPEPAPIAEASAASVEPAEAPAATTPGPPPLRPSAGRIVPPTIRLRIEEQRPTTPSPPLQTMAPRRVPRLAPRMAPAPAA
ncbi:MAG: translation initiation factor IF-2 N-terminal domain-containing protein, partial [Vicinamibacterales bacterium]